MLTFTLLQCSRKGGRYRFGTTCTSARLLQESALLSAGTESPLQTPLSGLMAIFAKIKS